MDATDQAGPQSKISMPYLSYGDRGCLGEYLKDSMGDHVGIRSTGIEDSDTGEEEYLLRWPEGTTVHENTSIATLQGADPPHRIVHVGWKDKDTSGAGYRKDPEPSDDDDDDDDDEYGVGTALVFYPSTKGGSGPESVFVFRNTQLQCIRKEPFQPDKGPAGSFASVSLVPKTSTTQAGVLWRDGHIDRQDEGPAVIRLVDFLSSGT